MNKVELDYNIGKGILPFEGSLTKTIQRFVELADKPLVDINVPWRRMQINLLDKSPIEKCIVDIELEEMTITACNKRH